MITVGKINLRTRIMSKNFPKLQEEKKNKTRNVLIFQKLERRMIINQYLTSLINIMLKNMEKQNNIIQKKRGKISILS